MKDFDYLIPTQEMLFKAFPNGIDESNYWILIHLLYDHMSDENLSLVMSNIVGKPIGIIMNDIYKVHKIKFDQKK